MFTHAPLPLLTNSFIAKCVNSTIPLRLDRSGWFKPRLTSSSISRASDSLQISPPPEVLTYRSPAINSLSAAQVLLRAAQSAHVKKYGFPSVVTVPVPVTVQDLRSVKHSLNKDNRQLWTDQQRAICENARKEHRIGDIGALSSYVSY